jgi:hypothetical protein
VSCDHEFTVPLFGLINDEWSDEVVGRACHKCWRQIFAGESIAWTGSSNTTMFADKVTLP